MSRRDSGVKLRVASAAIVLVFTVLLCGSVNLKDASAETTLHHVEISVQGLPSPFSTKVYVNGSFVTSVTTGRSISVDFNTSATVSVQQHIPEDYYSYVWTVGRALPYGGVAYYTPSNSRTFTSSGSYTFTYYPLYFLQVISEFGLSRGTGWHIAGSWAPIMVDTAQEVSSSVRYKFNMWKGGPLRDSPSDPINAVFMDMPKLVQAEWVTQYYVEVQSPFSNTTGEGWYDSGSEATFSVSTPFEAGEGIRYVFSGWSGDYSGTKSTATVTVGGPTRIVAEWRKQYLLSINPEEGKVDVNSGWFNEGQYVTVTATTPIEEVANSSRLVFSRWGGAVSTTNPTASLVMDSPKELHAEWFRQYFLSVQTEFGTAVGAGWYDADSTAEFSVQSPTAPAGIWGWFGVEYVFSHWAGDLSSPAIEASVVMHGSRVVHAVWSLSLTKFYIFLGAVTAVSITLWKKRNLRHLISSRLVNLRQVVERSFVRVSQSARSPKADCSTTGGDVDEIRVPPENL